MSSATSWRLLHYGDPYYPKLMSLHMTNSVSYTMLTWRDLLGHLQIVMCWNYSSHWSSHMFSCLTPHWRSHSLMIRSLSWTDPSEFMMCSALVVPDAYWFVHNVMTLHIEEIWPDRRSAMIHSRAPESWKTFPLPDIAIWDLNRHHAVTFNSFFNQHDCEDLLGPSS